jgi:hypothetical protein
MSEPFDLSQFVGQLHTELLPKIRKLRELSDEDLIKETEGDVRELESLGLLAADEASKVRRIVNSSSQEDFVEGLKDLKRLFASKGEGANQLERNDSRQNCTQH